MSLLTERHLPPFVTEQLPGSWNQWGTPALFGRLDAAEEQITRMRDTLRIIADRADTAERGAPGYFQFAPPRPDIIFGTVFHRNMPTVFDYSRANRQLDGGLFITPERIAIEGAVMRDPRGPYSADLAEMGRRRIDNLTASLQVVRGVRDAANNYHVFFHGMVYSPGPRVPLDRELAPGFRQRVYANIGIHNSINVVGIPFSDKYLRSGATKTLIYIHDGRLSPDNCRIPVADPRLITATQVSFMYPEGNIAHNATIIIIPPDYQYRGLHQVVDAAITQGWLAGADKQAMRQFMRAVAAQ